MSDYTQTIPLEHATRVTIEVTKANLTVIWRTDIDEILVSGPKVSVDRAGDELFLRPEHAGRSLFDLLPNISTPGVSIDWRGEKSSIEVSDEDGVIVRTGLGQGDSSSSGSTITVEVPPAITVATIEVDKGDLVLSSPSGNVDAEVKVGDLRSTQGSGNLTTQLGSGTTRIRDFSGSLDIMGGSGNIDIKDCQSSVHVKAGSGEVTLTGITGEKINLMAGSGDVSLRNCQARDFSCQSGSGDIVIQGGTLQEILIRSGSGDVDCSAILGPNRNSVTSGSGEIALGIPRDLSARIEAFTSSGDIDSEPQLVSVGQRGPKSRRSRRQVGSVGTGEPRAEVSVRTSSGDIRLFWLQWAEAPIPQAPLAPQPPVPPATPQQPVPPQSPAETSLPVRPDPASLEAEVSEPGEVPDHQNEILEALAGGDISVEEAELLLAQLEKDKLNRQ